MRTSLLAFAAAVGLIPVTVSASSADDWTANKLRGRVLQLVDNQWVVLERGMVVPDDRVIHTLGGAQVQFQRGEETIDLGPNTQIQIHDRGTAAKPNTTVQQYFGTVAVEAQVEQVQHFSVQTSYLAAVVKGTRFTVTSGKTGATVSVQRGHVAVEDNHDKSYVTLSVGQSATVDQIKTGGEISVSGEGVLPVVLDKHGKPIAPNGVAAEAKQMAAQLAAAAKLAEQKAKELKTPGAKAAADAAKKASGDAKKAADQAAKDAAKGDSGDGAYGGGGPGGDGGKDKPDKPDKSDKPGK